MSFTPNYISQRDPRWKDEKLGFDNTVTIGTDGSTLACLTMLVNGYGASETPSSMNRKLKDMGSGIGFLGSLIVWPGMARAFPKLNFRGAIVCRGQPAPVGEINLSLDSGQPLLIEIDQSPVPGLQNHWLVLYGRQGNDYLMLDPWPQPPDDAPVTLASRYGGGRPAREFITTVVWYDAVESPAPVPAPGKNLYVRVQSGIAAGLRLRASPTSANVIAMEAPGTLLLCLEPESLALPKIGILNQWLQVRDPGGVEGFVAAWYVDQEGVSAPAPEPTPARAPAPTPAPAPEPAQPPSPAPTAPPAAPAIPGLLTVLVSSQASAGLRLRDRPNDNGNTLEVLKPGTLLTVLEPAATARAKIGVVNQWLNVRLPGGMTGYVAAWYVTT